MAASIPAFSFATATATATTAVSTSPFRSETLNRASKVRVGIKDPKTALETIQKKRRENAMKQIADRRQMKHQEMRGVRNNNNNNNNNNADGPGHAIRVFMQSREKANLAQYADQVGKGVIKVDDFIHMLVNMIMEEKINMQDIFTDGIFDFLFKFMNSSSLLVQEGIAIVLSSALDWDVEIYTDKSPQNLFSQLFGFALQQISVTENVDEICNMLNIVQLIIAHKPNDCKSAIIAYPDSRIAALCRHENVKVQELALQFIRDKFVFSSIPASQAKHILPQVALAIVSDNEDLMFAGLDFVRCFCLLDAKYEEENQEPDRDYTTYIMQSRHLIARLINLCYHENEGIAFIAINCLEMMCHHADNNATILMLEGGIFPMAIKHFKNKNVDMRRDASSILRDIVACDLTIVHDQILQPIMFHPLIETALTDLDMETRMNAVMTVVNLIATTTIERTKIIATKAVAQILTSGLRMGEPEYYRTILEQAKKVLRVDPSFERMLVSQNFDGIVKEFAQDGSNCTLGTRMSARSILMRDFSEIPDPTN